MAVDRAIVEIISPVVDRSVTIACMTTQVRLHCRGIWVRRTGRVG